MGQMLGFRDISAPHKPLLSVYTMMVIDELLALVDIHVRTDSMVAFLPCNKLFGRSFGKNYYCTSIPSVCKY